MRAYYSGGGKAKGGSKAKDGGRRDAARRSGADAARAESSERSGRSNRSTDSLDNLRHRVVRDTRGAIGARRSALGAAFSNAEEYEAALLLHAFAEPPPQASRASQTAEQFARAGWYVRVDLLQRTHAWAAMYKRHTHGAPIVERGGGMGGGTLDVAGWRSVLNRWMHELPAAGIVLHEGREVIAGARRVHPSRRQPALSGWDTVRLLELFHVSKLADVPFLDEAGAERIWLEARDLQPPAGTAHVDSPHRGRAAAHGGLRRSGTSQSSADLLAARH